VFDTIAAESGRQLNETFTAFAQNRLPSYGQPDVDSMANLSAAIIVDQKRLVGNARSTVGTITDIYALLRLLFSRLGQPQVGYSNVFSFNDPAGMCQRCQGLGSTAAIDMDRLVDRSLSLNQGAIRFPTFAVGTWFWNLYALSGRFDLDKPVRDYSEPEWQALIFEDAGRKMPVATAGGEMQTSYEGLVPKFTRLYLSKTADDFKGKARAAFERIVTTAACAECGGSRLNVLARSSLIDGRSIAEHSAMPVRDLSDVIHAITAPAAAPLVNALAERLDNLNTLGLGYLTLSRQTSTLSGGESQRVKMVRHLGSALTDMCYIFDEPTVGLHPSDVHALGGLLKDLRDKGNTVLVVEHDPDVIEIADHCIDLGPGAGAQGGRVMYAGDLAGLAASGTTTGSALRKQSTLKITPRQRTGQLAIAHATRYNLRDVSVDLPLGVLTVVTGVAGSGKSTLVHGFVPAAHPDTVLIDQGPIRGSRRSNPATYTGLLEPVRKLFARSNKVAPALFSPNSAGACAECSGLGVIYTDLAFLEGVVTRCEVCRGRRFHDEVLQYTVRGRNIADVLAMSVHDALGFFDRGNRGEQPIVDILQRLSDVGLGYLGVGQALPTLSGGERQRLKLALELGSAGQVYVLDEPTTGLHAADVHALIGLLDLLVAGGSTVIVIEHNLDVVAQADWVIDLGPGPGRDGGRVVFQGTAVELARSEISVTGRYLARATQAHE